MAVLDVDLSGRWVEWVVGGVGDCCYRWWLYWVVAVVGMGCSGSGM